MLDQLHRGFVQGQFTQESCLPIYKPSICAWSISSRPPLLSADEELLGYLRENLVALFAAVRNGNPQIVEHSRSGGSNEILFVRRGHAQVRLQNI